VNKLFIYFIFFFFLFNIEGNSNEVSPVQQDFEEVFNVGKMLSHDINLHYILELEKKQF